MAGSEKRRVDIYINTEANDKALNRYTQEIGKLDKTLEKLEKGTEEYNKAETRRQELLKRSAFIQKKLSGEIAPSLKDLRSRYRDLNREISHLAPGTQEFINKTRQLQQVGKRIGKVKDEMNGVNRAMEFFKGQAAQFGFLALGFLGIQELTNQIGNIISRSAKLSDALSDVEKTTGLAKEEVEELNQELSKINTRTSRQELLELAKIAGKLGKTTKKDVLEFVNAANMINVALGEDLGETETVMRELGKLVETFNLSKVYSTEEGLLKVGSAINAIGASSTANERYLVDFAKRMGGIAPLAGITIADTLALGATLDQLGQTSETSSTALSKLFVQMAKDAETYAELAGMDVNEFKTLLDTDMIEAFKAVLTGAENSSDGMNALAETLGDLGLDGGRVIGVFGSLANNIGLLEEQQQLANEEFLKGDSILEEYNKKNENFAANVEKLQKWLYGLFVNSDVVNGLQKLVGWMVKLTEVKVSEKMEADRRKLIEYEVKLNDVNTSQSERLRLIQELKDQYPGYLDDVNTDKGSTEELTSALRALNNEMLNRIVLQKHQQKINENIQNIAEARKAVGESEDNFAKEVGKLRDRLINEEGFSEETVAFILKNAKTAQEQLQAMGKFIEEENRKGNIEGFFITRGATKATTELSEARRALNELEKENNNLLEEKTKLMKELGLSNDDLFAAEADQRLGNNKTDTNTPAGEGGESGDGDGDKQKDFDRLLAQLQQLDERVRAKKEELALAQMDALDAEYARIAQHYVKLLAENERYQQQITENETLTEEERQALLEQAHQQELALIEQREAELDAKRKEIAEKRKQEELAEQEEVGQATLSEEEKEIERITAYYDNLIALAEKHGLDAEALELAKASAIAKIQKEFRQKTTDEKLAAYQAELDAFKAFAGEFSGVVTNMNALIGHQGGQMIGFQKLMAAAQIALNTGAAISDGIKLATASSTAEGPIGFWTVAGKIAAITSSLLASFAGAKNILSRVEEPPPPQLSIRGRGRFTGGETYGSTGLGFGDAMGEFVGFNHRNEYVVPAITRQDPVVANLIPLIESRRQEAFGTANAAREGAASPDAAVPVQQDFSPLIAEIQMLQKIVAEKEFNAQLQMQWDTLQQIKDGLEKLNANQNDTSL